jgi:hypothetical protein
MRWDKDVRRGRDLQHRHRVRDLGGAMERNELADRAHSRCLWRERKPPERGVLPNSHDVHRSRELHRQQHQAVKRDVGGAMERKKLDDPAHPQLHPSGHSQRPVGSVVHRTRGVHRCRVCRVPPRDVGGALERDELENPAQPLTVHCFDGHLGAAKDGLGSRGNHDAIPRLPEPAEHPLGSLPPVIASLLAQHPSRQHERARLPSKAIVVMRRP